MYMLKRDNGDTIDYFKWDGWVAYPRKGPLDLTGCVLFTKGEVELNPPKHNEVYQHYGCYQALGRYK